MVNPERIREEYIKICNEYPIATMYGMVGALLFTAGALTDIMIFILLQLICLPFQVNYMRDKYKCG